jgi:capsular exopolysaccharide synthesis family protein
VDLAQILKVVRRRWVAVTVTIAVALGAGWASTQLISTKSPPQPFRATAVLISETVGEETGGYPLQTVAALVKFDGVASRVAETVGYQGELQKLTRKVRATANEETGILRITAVSPDAKEARSLADTFADQLIAFLNRAEIQTAKDQIKAAETELARIQPALDAAVANATANPRDPIAQSELAFYQGEYDTAFRLKQEAEGQIAGVTSRLSVLQDAVPVRASAAGIVDVRSAPVRLILAGLLGVIGGLAIAIMLDRLDNKLRTKGEVERRTNLPVLAEIPMVREWKNSDGGIAVAMTPKSPEADAFRLLAAALTRRPPQAPQTILVTSPGPSEGKTTVTANLAATFAEVGKKVIVLSADLHRPRIHVLFGVPNMSGLTEALETPSDNGALLTQKNWRTSIDRVHLVPSGSSPENPGELLSSPNMRKVLEEAREVADIVLLDTPPILAASDSAQLLSEVDAVLLVVRGDKTLESSAEKTAELFRGLNVPVVGAVLNEAAEASAPRSYYDYYAEPNGRPASRRSVRPLLTRMRGGG